MTNEQVLEYLQKEPTPVKLQVFARRYGLTQEQTKKSFEQLLQEGKIKTNLLYGSYKRFSAVTSYPQL